MRWLGRIVLCRPPLNRHHRETNVCEEDTCLSYSQCLSLLYQLLRRLESPLEAFPGIGFPCGRSDLRLPERHEPFQCKLDANPFLPGPLPAEKRVQGGQRCNHERRE